MLLFAVLHARERLANGLAGEEGKRRSVGGREEKRLRVRVVGGGGRSRRRRSQKKCK